MKHLDYFPMSKSIFEREIAMATSPRRDVTRKIVSRWLGEAKQSLV